MQATMNTRLGYLTGRIKAYHGLPMPPAALYASTHTAYYNAMDEGYGTPIPTHQVYKSCVRERQLLSAAIGYVRSDLTMEAA